MMSLRPDQWAWRRLIERWNADERAFSATIDGVDGTLVARASADPALEPIAAVHSHWGRSTLVFRLAGVGATEAERTASQAWVLIDEFAEDRATLGFVKADGLEGVARMLGCLEPFDTTFGVEPSAVIEED